MVFVVNFLKKCRVHFIVIQLLHLIFGMRNFNGWYSTEKELNKPADFILKFDSEEKQEAIRPVENILKMNVIVAANL